MKLTVTALTITAAAALALTGCSSSAPAATTASPTTTVTVTATPTPTPTATPSPTPTAVKTSGNYGADLAAAGTVPDSVDAFGKYMAEEFCESPMGDGFSNFKSKVDRFGKPGSESSGSGPSVVRLTVAYYCPTRTQAAEKALADLGYTK